MDPAPPPPARDRVGSGVTLLAVVPVAVVLLAELPQLHWTLDLVRHFAFQGLLSLLGCAALLLLVGRRRTALFAAVLTLLPTAHLLPLWLAPATSAALDAPRLRVATINLLASNREIERAARWIEATDPDVVALLEFTAAHEKALSPLRARWPHGAGKAVDSPFGIALWSKTPLVDAEVIAYGATWSWAVRAKVATPIGVVGVLAMHVPPPIAGDHAAYRDRAFAQFADVLAPLPALRVVLGDGNATRWSRAFAAGLANARLRDSCEGFGFQGSWPTGLPWWLRVPIDHVLVADGLAVVRRELGPDVGSDHLPVVAEIAVASQ